MSADHREKLGMIGAIVMTGVFAVPCSGLATIGNRAIARDFSDVKLDADFDIYSDPLFAPAAALRYERYRLTANVFYHQARALWAVLILLVGYKFFIGLL
jgi:hypothetical protein